MPTHYHSTTSHLPMLIKTNPNTISLNSDTLLKIYQSVTNNKPIAQSVYNPPRSRKLNILSD